MGSSLEPEERCMTGAGRACGAGSVERSGPGERMMAGWAEGRPLIRCTVCGETGWGTLVMTLGTNSAGVMVALDGACEGACVGCAWGGDLAWAGAWLWVPGCPGQMWCRMSEINTSVLHRRHSTVSLLSWLLRFSVPPRSRERLGGCGSPPTTGVIKPARINKPKPRGQ